MTTLPTVRLPSLPRIGAGQVAPRLGKLPRLPVPGEAKPDQSYARTGKLTTPEIISLAGKAGDRPQAQPTQQEEGWWGPVNKVLQAFDFLGNETRRVAYGHMFSDEEIAAKPINFAGRAILSGEDILAKAGMDGGIGRAILGLAIDITHDPLIFLGGPAKAGIKAGIAGSGRAMLTHLPALTKGGMRTLGEVAAKAAASGKPLEVLRASRFAALFDDADTAAKFMKGFETAAKVKQGAGYVKQAMSDALGMAFLQPAKSAARKVATDFILENARKGMGLLHVPFTSIGLELPGIGRLGRSYRTLLEVRDATALADKMPERLTKALDAFENLKTAASQGFDYGTPLADLADRVIGEGRVSRGLASFERGLRSIPERLPLVGRMRQSEARNRIRAAQNAMSPQQRAANYNRLVHVEMKGFVEAIAGRGAEQQKALFSAFEFQRRGGAEWLAANWTEAKAKAYKVDDPVVKGWLEHPNMPEYLDAYDKKMAALAELAGMPYDANYVPGMFTKAGYEAQQAQNLSAGRSPGNVFQHEKGSVAQPFNVEPESRLVDLGARVERSADGKYVRVTGPNDVAEILNKSPWLLDKIIESDGRVLVFERTLANEPELWPLRRIVDLRNQADVLAAAVAKGDESLAKTLERARLRSAGEYFRLAVRMTDDVKLAAKKYEGEQAKYVEWWLAHGDKTAGRLGKRIDQIDEQAAKLEAKAANMRSAAIESGKTDAAVDAASAALDSRAAALRKLQAAYEAEFDQLAAHAQSLAKPMTAKQLKRLGKEVNAIERTAKELFDAVDAIRHGQPGVKLTNRNAAIVAAAEKANAKRRAKLERVRELLTMQGADPDQPIKLLETGNAERNVYVADGAMAWLFGPGKVGEFFEMDPVAQLANRWAQSNVADSLTNLSKLVDDVSYKVPASRGARNDDAGIRALAAEEGKTLIEGVPYRAIRIDSPNSVFARFDGDGLEIKSYVPAPFADAIERTARYLDDDHEITGFLKMFAWLTSKWKVLTLLHPAWFVVNETQVMSHAVEGAKLRHMILDHGKADRLAGKFMNGKVTDELMALPGMGITEKAAFDRYFALGGMDSLATADIAPDIGAMQAKLYGTAVGNVAGKATKALGDGVAAAFKLNARRDLTWKLAAMMSYMRQGMDLDTAIQKALLAGFDYADPGKLGRTGNQLMTTMVPFYRWIRNATPFWLYQAAMRPAVFAAVPREAAAFQSAMVGYQSMPEELRPDWFRKELGIQIFGDQRTGHGVMVNSLLPTQNAVAVMSGAFGLGGPADEVMSNVNPVFTWLAEAAAGRRFYSRQEFEPGSIPEEAATRFVGSTRLVRDTPRLAKMLSEGRIGDFLGRLLLGGRVQPLSADKGLKDLSRRTEIARRESIAKIKRALHAGDSSVAGTEAVRWTDTLRRRAKFGLPVPKAARGQIGLPPLPAKLPSSRG